MSVFTMHSFGRVVRRHEREAILQHPSAWDPMYRAELEASRAFRQGNMRRPFSPISTISRRPLRRNNSEHENPFQDSPGNRSIAPSSTYSFTPDNEPPYITPRYESQAWRSIRDVPTSASLSDEISPAPTPVDRLNTPMNWSSVLILPSPVPTEVPSPSTQGRFTESPSMDSHSIVYPIAAVTDDFSPSLRIRDSFPRSFDSAYWDSDSSSPDVGMRM